MAEKNDVTLLVAIKMNREQWENLKAAAEPGTGFTRDFTPPNGEAPADPNV